MAVLLQQRWTLLGRYLRQRGSDLFDDDVWECVQPEGPQRQGEECRLVVGRHPRSDVWYRRRRVRVGGADWSKTRWECAQAVLVHWRCTVTWRQDDIRCRLWSYAERNLRFTGSSISLLQLLKNWTGQGKAYITTLALSYRSVILDYAKAGLIGGIWCPRLIYSFSLALTFDLLVRKLPNHYVLDMNFLWPSNFK